VNDRIAFAVVAVLSIATLAIGLRVGAGEAMHAAIVNGAPLPKGGGRLAWQLRTEADDLHSRTEISTRFTATVRARVGGSAAGGTPQAKTIERVVRGATNLDGIAELAFDAPGLAWGDPVELDVRDGRGGVLARGAATWPAAPPKHQLVEPSRLRPARSTGALRMRVSILGAALAPGQAGRVWITTAAATGEPPRDLRIDATPDLGVEVASPYAPSGDPSCKAGVLELVARGLSAGLALHAKDGLGREGDWYGGVTLAPGAMLVTAPVFAEPGPVRVSIASASARTLAYVEVDDDVGRVAAVALPLAGAPPHGETSFDLRARGRYFLVVSGEPDGAENVTGATRALPIFVGDRAPCEADLADVAAASFPRFVALDGFVEKRAALAARHRKGRFVALLGLVLGSFLETLLLLRAARDGRRKMTQLQDALRDDGESADAAAVAQRHDPLDVVVFLGLSLLGFVLLFALVVAFATK
jgi:hypothetical protein